MHNFKIGFNFVKHYLNQTYILALGNDETSKLILFSKINRFLRSTTQRVETQKLDKKKL